MTDRTKDNPMLEGIDTVEPYLLNHARDLYGIDPPSLIIDNFLPRGGIMGITAFPGVGKSWLTLEIIRAVSTSGKFLNRFASQEGSCLFVGSDSSIFDYAYQWTRLVQTDELAHQNILIGIEPGQEESTLAPSFGPDWEQGPFNSVRFLLQSPFMFESPDEIRRLIATCQRHEWGPYEDRYDEYGTFLDHSRRKGFDVIVFDTLSKLTRANQNDNTEMEEVFRNVRLISEATGAACILLHHNAKKSEYNDGADWRGALSQIAALDSWVQLTPSKKEKYLIGIEFKKFRGITPESFTYRMNVSDPATASLVSTPEDTFEAAEKGIDLTDTTSTAILKYMHENPSEWVAASTIRKNIWPSFVDLYETERKLDRAIRNRLSRFSQLPGFSIEMKAPEVKGERDRRVKNLFRYIPPPTPEAQ